MDEDLRHTYDEICRLDYYDLLSDYEFIYEPEFYTRYLGEAIRKSSTFANKCKHIYFEKENDNKYKELLSKRVFEKEESVSDDIYYNQETGLYFNIKNATKGIDLASVAEELSPEYVKTLDDYFHLYTELQRIDNNLYLKGISLMLTRK